MEITILKKADGPLTKRIELVDGKVIADGSACLMASGTATRFRFDRIEQLGDLIAGLRSDEAIALGRLRSDLPDRVDVVTKRQLAEHPDSIGRTAEYFEYPEGEPAICLIDFDRKGMPEDVKARIKQNGGLWYSLIGVIPELAAAARLTRSSTSSGIHNEQTGEVEHQTGGHHIYVVLQDGQQIEEFLSIVHQRCWLAGLGWMLVGAGGQLLERSIVDRMVYGPERLIFEGAPTVVPPLRQDTAARQPKVKEGATLDLPPTLTKEEKAELAQLIQAEIKQLAPESKRAREEFTKRQGARIRVRNPSLTVEESEQQAERMTKGELGPSVVLAFDDPDLEGRTVADVLADPKAFEGVTLADPVEGVTYGRGKAKVLLRRDGTPWIRSFAHALTEYRLDPGEAPRVARSCDPPWPEPLGDAAYHGIAGEFVRLVEPHTEADPAALLLQLLAFSGNVFGETAWVTIERTRHFASLFLAVVGNTAKARKGTSEGWVRDLMFRAVRQWVERCIVSGLSTGEGLIAHVRDPEHGKDKKGADIIVNPGVEDKRLLIVEAEFSRVLRVMERQNATLSAVLRDAWDHKPLRIMTKSDPARATGATVSIVAHITSDELKRDLTDVSTANGFGNRFLWCCARRSKRLPEGGSVDEGAMDELGTRLRCIFDHHPRGQIRFDEIARKLWHERYDDLTEDRPGMLGALTARSEAQVIHVALIYALLDRQPLIGKAHLEAALEIVRYSNECVRYLFGDTTGNTVADTILAALRTSTEGLTRTTISCDLFGRNTPAVQISDALAELLKMGKARPCLRNETRGRPAETWVAL
jgi:hypothetical protein